MFGQLLFAPLGNALILEDFVAPSTVELRRVFPTMVCVKMFGEELGPGNEPCEDWNQPLILETPNLEAPVASKCSCHEWDELIPEFRADFVRVHKLDGGRMELAREATAVRATGEAKAIHALVAAHSKFDKVLTELSLFLLSQNCKACKRVSGGGKTAKGEAAACLLLLNYCNLLRRTLRVQRREFEKEAAEMLPTARSLAEAA